MAPTLEKAKVRKRKRNRKTDVSYGIFEAACQSVGISMVTWYPKDRVKAAMKIASKLRRK